MANYCKEKKSQFHFKTMFLGLFFFNITQTLCALINILSCTKGQLLSYEIQIYFRIVEVTVLNDY